MFIVSPVTPVTGTVTNLPRFLRISLSRKARLPIVICVPVSMTASSGRPAALTWVRINWPRKRRPITTISPGSVPDRNAGVLDLDQALVEIHHQPLFDQGVDADHAVAAEVRFPQGGKLQVAHGGRPEGQLGHLHPVDDVARGHGVEDRGRAERKLQAAGDAQADDGRIGAAVDDEIVGTAAVDQNLDGQAGFDLAGLQVFAADGERGVEEGGRKRRNVGGRVRRGAGLADLRRLGGRDVARRAGEHQPEQDNQGMARRWQSASPLADRHYPPSAVRPPRLFDGRRYGGI